MTRGGASGRLAALQARLRRKGGKGTGSRHLAGRLAFPANPAPGAACRLGALKASNEGKAIGGCFSGDSAGLAGGILKTHNQEGKQRLGNYKDKVLTRLWRCTLYVSTAGWCHHFSSKTPSSCGVRRSPRGTDSGARCEDQRVARMEKHPGGQPQGRQAGRSNRAPPPDGLPRPREPRFACPHRRLPQGGLHKLRRMTLREPRVALAPRYQSLQPQVMLASLHPLLGQDQCWRWGREPRRQDSHERPRKASRAQPPFV